MTEEIKKLRRRVEDRLRMGQDSDIIKTARMLGLSNGWVQIESSYSGDSVETVYGELTHTNGHFGFSLIDRIFYFRDITPLAGYQVLAGTPESCGLAAFNIETLEQEISNLIATEPPDFGLANQRRISLN